MVFYYSINVLKKYKAVLLLNALMLFIQFTVQSQKLFSGINAKTKKLSPSLHFYLRDCNKNEAGEFVVACNSTDDVKKQIVATQKNIKILREETITHTLLIESSVNVLLKEILPLPSVVFVDKYFIPTSEAGVIGYSRFFHGINMVDYAIPSANGKNITVGVKEQRMDSSDLDLYKRVKVSAIAAPAIESHATSMATLIGGAGNSFYNGRGIAHGCNFFSSNFNNLFADDPAILNQNKVTVQNHSYGTIVQQFYGAEALSYDMQSWQNKNLLHVFSAGNRGATAANDGQYAGIVNYANLTGNFKMAKNVISVGAIDDKGNIASLSSAGPAYDGRLAPQITALGPNGTSDAAAIVSGTAAVMQQVYADSNAQQLPSSALIKAIIYNTAEEIGRPGIDYKTGFGLLNCFEAVKAVQNKNYSNGIINQSQVWQKDISVSDAAILKVTLTWTDSAAAINNTKALLNDLDLEVVELSTGTTYKPWVLNTAPMIDSLVKLPIRKRDSLNTAEQVSIHLPTNGVYKLKVSGTNVVNNNLPFSIVYSADTLNRFYFTNPRHTSDINRQESAVLPIRWRTAVTDTNQTGNLSISYDNGLNWQILENGFKIYKQQYNWDIKDTASTVLFRMQTSFGSFTTVPVVISKVSMLQVDFLCADSFRLSWPKHIYANAYDVYALADSAYLKRVRTVTDTFSVFQKNIFPYQVYAIQPVLTNNVTAARSVAVNISLQSVNCFYRALNYTQLDSNSIRLSLELSTNANVDSICFERINAAGAVLQRYGDRKIFGTLLTHLQAINNIPAGINYFRARIKLDNSAVVFSDIVTIVSSGENSIWVYPNPIRSNGILNYFLRNQGQFFRLQIVNNSGQSIKDWEVAFSGAIKLPFLANGVYYLKLVNAKGKLAGSTKLLIQ